MVYTHVKSFAIVKNCKCDCLNHFNGILLVGYSISHYCRFSTECASGRILIIAEYLVKIWT